MKKILLALVILSLGACKTIDVIPEEHRTVKEVKYIVRVPPADTTTLPKKPEPIDVDTASQSEVAGWLITKEAYTLQLENMLKRIAEFLLSEQAILDAKAAEENRKAREEAEAALGTTPAN
jgi:hypothetical protein